MIHRLYVHNFRCLQNFTLELRDVPSALLIGANGAGKSTVRLALELLQSIARGKNRIGDLVSEKDFTGGRSSEPMRFELVTSLGGITYRYVLGLELPPRFRELRVLEERFFVGETEYFAREIAAITIHRGAGARFSVDWHRAALPLIQEESLEDPLHVFRSSLARMVIVAPLPPLIHGISAGDTLNLERDGSNLASVLSALTTAYPASYASVDRSLKSVMPEFAQYTNVPVGEEARRLRLKFRRADAPELDLPFDDLSDGEKCFVLSAVILAAAEFVAPMFCFWDEPDQNLGLSEVGHFVLALRRAFEKSGGQFVATSHHPEAIETFSRDNTFLLHRRSRLDPTTVHRVRELTISGDLVPALTRGDLEP